MTTKPFAFNEPVESQKLSEPSVSYGLPQDMASLKLEAINELMNIFDSERLSKAINYLRSLGREEAGEIAGYPYYPSTSEALKKELSEAEDDFNEGRTYSSDDLRKEMLKW